METIVWNQHKTQQTHRECCVGAISRARAQLNQPTRKKRKKIEVKLNEVCRAIYGNGIV